MAIDEILEAIKDVSVKAGRKARKQADRFLRWANNKRSRTKLRIDAYLDPSLFWLTANGVGAWFADKGIDAVSQNVDSHEGLAVFGAYVVSGAAAVAANNFLIVPAAKRIKDFYNTRVEGADTTRLFWSCGRTIAQGGLMLGLVSLLNFSATIGNFKYDTGRVIGAFAREKPTPITVMDGTLFKEQALPEYPVKTNGDPIVTGALAGRNLKNFYASHTGINGVVPDTVNVDFVNQLREKWAVKKKRFPGSWVFKAAGDRLIEEYASKKPTTMTLDDYVEVHDSVLEQVNENLDWGKLRKLKGLNSDELELLKVISSSLAGKDMISYGLTELMPSRIDGDLNKAVLDFLLRNAGREYVEAIPATGDNYTSFGLYQPTQFAVYEAVDKKTGRMVRSGASIINQALPAYMRIPGSVIKLRGDDHPKAAYLLAINNLADLINSLSRAEYDILQKRWKDHKDDIVKYVATAHHLPSKARKAAKLWLDNRARYDFTVSCGDRIRVYSQKTNTNYRAMHNLLRLEIEEPEVVFADLNRVNSEGFRILRYDVKLGDSPSMIAQKFNVWDKKYGDKYAAVSFKQVVDGNGASLNVIHPGRRVYVKAARRKT